MKVLITGGNGFIGSHLSDFLFNLGYELTLFDLNFNRNTNHLNVNKVVGDIRKFKDLKRVVKGQDVIIHLAAVSRVKWGEENPIKCINVNVYGTLNLLNTIAKVNPNAFLIFGSSREVYGDPLKLPVVENHPKNPKSIYGMTKLMGENLIKIFNKKYGLNYFIVRFSNVYGSERDHLDRVIPKFILNALSGKDLEVYGNGVFDFTYIDDVIGALKTIIKKTQNDDIVNDEIHITTGRGTSLLELAKKIIKMCHSESEIKKFKAEDFYVSNFVGDYSKAKKLLNYKPRVFLNHGLKILKNRLKKVLYEEDTRFGMWKK
ncbi:MAG: GDP-mannose 4,6-dehydratase [Candidatus Aenigmatarchaeota archaeon]